MTFPRFMGLAIVAALPAIPVSRVSAQSTRVGEAGEAITSLTQMQRHAGSPTALNAIPAGTDLSVNLGVMQDAGVAPAISDESSTRGGSAHAKGMPSLSSFPQAPGQVNANSSRRMMRTSASLQSTPLGARSTLPSLSPSGRSGLAAAPFVASRGGNSRSGTAGPSQNQQSRLYGALNETGVARETAGQSNATATKVGSDLRHSLSSGAEGGWEGFEPLADPLRGLAENGFESPQGDRGWETLCSSACGMRTAGAAEPNTSKADQDTKTNLQIFPSRRGRSSRQSVFGTGRTSSPSKQRHGMVQSEGEQP